MNENIQVFCFTVFTTVGAAALLITAASCEIPNTPVSISRFYVIIVYLYINKY